MSSFGFTLAVPDRTGAARMALAYASRLVERGHTVTVGHGWGVSDYYLSRIDESIVPEFESAGVSCVPLATLGRPLGRRARRELDSFVANVDVAVGVNQRDRAALIASAKRRGIPSAAMAQNQHTFSGRLGLATLKQMYYRYWIQRADRIICSSTTVRDELVRDFAVDPERAPVVFNGIDTTRFGKPGTHRQVTRTSLELGSRRTLICVGRIDPQKGQDILVKALATLPRSRISELCVLLVGDVVQDSRIDETRRYELELHAAISAADLGSTVLFLGWRDDVIDLLTASDVFVLPSRWEGWSLALVEGMAAGLPVIATDCSGRPTNFTDGPQGRIVPTGDVQSLAAGIAAMMELDDESLRLGGSANQDIARANYDIDQQSDLFAELVEQLASNTERVS